MKKQEELFYTNKGIYLWGTVIPEYFEGNIYELYVFVLCYQKN